MRIGIVAVAGLMVGMGAASAQQAKPATVTAGQPVQVEPDQQAQKAAAMRSLEAMKEAMKFTLAGQGCPGQLAARQQATGGSTVWTTAYEDRGEIRPIWTVRPEGLGIHVEFASAKTAVKDLELRVSYLPLRLRSVPLGAQLTDGADKSPQEKEKRFNLSREAAIRIGGDLLVGPAATITRVHLLSATFADGSVWHAPSDDACSIVPSKFMLVEAKK